MRDLLLSIQNVEAYYGSVIAIRGISLELYQGQLATLLGANGAGKTTLLKTISGVLAPQKGEILFQGRSIGNQLPEKIVRDGIVHVPEGREIFPFLSVADNLSMGAYTRQDRLEIETDREMVFDYFPILRSRAKQQAGYLSGGQQQMLAIGRALMARPRLMLLDEPSLGLSPLLVKEIMDIIQRLNQEQKVTMLLVEQNAKLALEIADHGFVMETGRIVMADSAEVLMTKSDIKEFYLGGSQSADDGAPRERRRWRRKKTWR